VGGSREEVQSVVTLTSHCCFLTENAGSVV
jgi:hypothetical protein